MARIINQDPADLWAHIRPENSRRLLLAALDAFATLGFEGATTREIATRAELSPAAVYVHYDAKVDLLQQILEVGHQAVWDALADALEGVEGPGKRVQVFAEAFGAWHACNYTLGRVSDYELPALPDSRMHKVLAVRRRIESLVRNELRRGVHDEGFVVPDLRGTSLAIISVGVDLVRWYSPERGISPAEIAMLHGQLVLRIVKPWGRRSSLLSQHTYPPLYPAKVPHPGGASSLGSG